MRRSAPSAHDSDKPDSRSHRRRPGGVTRLRVPRRGHRAGIKRPRPDGTAPLDLAVLVSDAPATAAAVFTINKAQAAPVLVSREHLDAFGRRRARHRRQQRLRECLHGRRGHGQRARHGVGNRAPGRLPAKTGARRVDRRHRRRPADRQDHERRCRAAFAALGARSGSGGGARDHDHRSVSEGSGGARRCIDGREAVIGGMAKGSGMIEPMMATMLGFVTTDASVPQPLLQRALREAVNTTFNAITVDGECSTNDSVMLLANGRSGASVNEASYDGVRRRPARRVPRARARHRPRRRGRDQAGHRQGHGRRVRERSAKRGQGDCQLPARQDGDSRRRPELGPADCRRRPRRRRVRAEPRRS